MALALFTWRLAIVEVREGRENRELSRESIEEMQKGRLISNYPLLSQKIDTKVVSSDLSVDGADMLQKSHFMLKIKNYGQGPAINQSWVYYRFYEGENQTHQRSVPITGAHNVIAPLDERPLDMTKLVRDDWNMDMVKRYDNIWVRLPHEDIQRNKCCTCTKYIYQPQIRGKYGMVERYWYFSALPEISSEICESCEWNRQEE